MWAIVWLQVALVVTVMGGRKAFPLAHRTKLADYINPSGQYKGISPFREIVVR